MEAGRPQEREASIVLVGDFDPLMLVPQWFVNQGLLPPEDLRQNLTIEIIYKDLTRFTLPNIVVEVSPTKLLLRSDIQSIDFQIVDMAVGVLSALPKVKVTAVGLNLQEDYYIEDRKIWDGVGDLLVPKKFWYDLVPGSPKTGLAKLQMQVSKPELNQVSKSETSKGYYNFSVIWLDKPGWTRFQTNDHYDSNESSLAKGKKYELVTSKNAKFDALSVIMSGWESSRDFHLKAVKSILDNAAGAYYHGHG